MRRRRREWLRRYAPAELLALIGAFAGYLLAELVTGNRAAAAYAAVLGDSLGYYGLLMARQVTLECRTARTRGAGEWLRIAVRTVRVLVVEFGPAEALDSAIVRPACTTVATAALGPAGGVLVAKVVADVAFYVPVIATYELGVRRSIVQSSTERRARLNTSA